MSLANPPGSTLTRRALLSLLAASSLPAAQAQSGGDAAAAGGDVGYRFSPVPQHAIPLVAGYWNPILAWVSARSGVKLSLKISRTSAETTAYVLKDEAEFVFSNHLFSPEREALGWKVFGRRQTPAVQGQIIVPAESPITTLAQLSGKEVAFPGAEAFVAYKVPMAQLMLQKVDAKAVFGGNMDGALAQMYAGKTAAAGVNSQLAQGHARRENRQYRVLWSSEPFHDLALMASSRVPKRDLDAVAAAFVAMHKDPAGLEILTRVSQQVGLTQEAHFIPATGADYDAYRRFYQSAPPALR